MLESEFDYDLLILVLSMLSGAHINIYARVLELLKARNATDILLVGGGVMPREDVDALKAMGVAEILLQDASPEHIVSVMQKLVADRGPR